MVKRSEPSRNPEQTAEQKELTQLLIRSARALLDLLGHVGVPGRDRHQIGAFVGAVVHGRHVHAGDVGELAQHVDDSGLRASMIESFRLRGIRPESVGSLAVQSLLLDAEDLTLQQPDKELAAIVGKLFGIRYLATLFGMTLLSHQIGGFLGAWLGGLARPGVQCHGVSFVSRGTGPGLGPERPSWQTTGARETVRSHWPDLASPRHRGRGAVTSRQQPEVPDIPTNVGDLWRLQEATPNEDARRR